MNEYTLSETVVFTDFDDESGLLINTETKRYYELNETGTFIWKRLADNQPLGEIAREMTENYEVTDEKAAASVENFLHNLKAQNLVKAV